MKSELSAEETELIQVLFLWLGPAAFKAGV